MANSVIPEALMAKIKEVIADPTFVKSLLEMKDVKNILKAFGEKGIELSSEEAGTLSDCIKNGALSGELDEAALEEVAGGVNILGVKPAATKIMGVKPKIIT